MSLVRPPRKGVLFALAALSSVALVAPLSGRSDPAESTGSPAPAKEESRNEAEIGPPLIDEGFLDGADGLPLYHRVVGSSGPTLVAVHGGPGAGMSSFYPELRPLAREHRVIFYDQRGGGRSGLPEVESLLDAAFFVEDLESVRRHFGIERLNLVAHSFGAVLVASYAQRYPEKVAKIALLGATGPQRSIAAARAEGDRESVAPEEQERLRDALMPLLQGTADDPVAACRRYEELLEQQADRSGEPGGWEGSTCNAPPEAVAYYYSRTARLTPRSLGDWNFTEGLEEVRAPVLVISGDRVSAALEQQRAWAAAYPNGRLLVIPGAGKAAVATHPDPVLDALTRFFGGESR